MKQKKINIGLFGFGTVGKGLYDVLQRIQPQNVKIVSVCVEDITKKRDADIPFTNRADDIFNNKDINFIVMPKQLTKLSSVRLLQAYQW